MIIVTGQPRSGTSLMMRMLHMASVDIIADEVVSYEYGPTVGLKEDNEWVLGLKPDCALKVLFPHVMHLPIGKQYKMIWMYRNPKEQAKSQQRFVGEHRKLRGVRRKTIEKIDRTIPPILKKHTDVLMVPFDRLLNTKDVGGVSEWLEVDLDPSWVHDRHPKCSSLPKGALESRRPQLQGATP